MTFVKGLLTILVENRHMEDAQPHIAQVPLCLLEREGQSQRDRVLMEVMEKLFTQLPKDENRPHDFVLSNGTKCWVKKFSPPGERSDGTVAYGFDVKFSDEAPLSHMEFFVKCTGWERNLSSRDDDTAPNAV